MEKTQFTLPSTALFHTPGLLRWAINGYKFKRDRKKLLRVFTEGFSGDNAPTPDVWDKLLKGEIPWKEENECVVFEAEMPAKFTSNELITVGEVS